VYAGLNCFKNLCQASPTSLFRITPLFCTVVMLLIFILIITNI